MKITDKLPWRVQSQLGYRPRGIYKGFEDYNKINPSKSSVRKVLNEGWFHLNPPIHSTKILPHNFYEVISQEYSQANIYTINDASILMNDHQIGVISNDNKLIVDKTFYYESKFSTNHPFLSIQKIPEAKSYKGKCLVLAAAGSDTFYWHWMIDSIPKYGIIELIRQTSKDFDFILINEMLRPFHKQTLDILNIPSEKILTIKDGDRFSFDKMIIPSKLRYNPWIIHYLRNRLLPTNKNLKKPELNLFVSRAKARWRKIENEDEIYNFLHNKYGFIKVFFEDLSIQEQINIVQNTNATFSLVGSNQINMIFYPPGAKVIEIQPKGLSNVANWILAEQCGHQYAYLEGEISLNNQKEIGDEYKDIIVDINQVEKLLENFFFTK